MASNPNPCSFLPPLASQHKTHIASARSDVLAESRWASTIKTVDLIQLQVLRSAQASLADGTVYIFTASELQMHSPTYACTANKLVPHILATKQSAPG